MAIVETVNDLGIFYDWLQQSSGYRDNFTFEGAAALMEYLDQLSEDIGESIEFDPIAFCVEYTEYKDLNEVKDDYPHIRNLEDLEDHTTVIEFDGGLIIQDF